MLSNQLSSMSKLIAISLVLLSSPVFGKTIEVPCVNGGGSGGWMFSNLPGHYFPLKLIKINKLPQSSIKKHPMYVPNVFTNTYGTCIVIPAKHP